MQRFFLGEDEDGEQIEVDESLCAAVTESDQEMADAIAADATGIGFMLIGTAADADLTVLDIDGEAATAENIAAGGYPYYYELSLVTIGEVSEDITAFVTYCNRE